MSISKVVPIGLIVIAAGVNTISKTALAASTGGLTFGKLLLPALVVTLIAGGAGTWLALRM